MYGIAVLRARSFCLSVLLGAFCASGLMIADASAQAHNCRTAADDAEIAKMDKELTALQSHRWSLQIQRRIDEGTLAMMPDPKTVAPADKKADQEARDALTKSLAEKDKEIAKSRDREDVLKGKIADLLALPPCREEHWTTPQPPPPAGRTNTPLPLPPLPARKLGPCRTADDDAALAQLEKDVLLVTSRKWSMEERKREDEDALRHEMKQYPRRPAIIDGLKRRIAGDDWIVQSYYAAQKDLEKQIEAIKALKPCEHWTTPQPTAPATPPAGPGNTPAPGSAPNIPAPSGPGATPPAGPGTQPNMPAPPATPPGAPAGPAPDQGCTDKSPEEIAYEIDMATEELLDAMSDVRKAEDVVQQDEKRIDSWNPRMGGEKNPALLEMKAQLGMDAFVRDLLVIVKDNIAARITALKNTKFCPQTPPAQPNPQPPEAPKPAPKAEESPDRPEIGMIIEGGPGIDWATERSDFGKINWNTTVWRGAAAASFSIPDTAASAQIGGRIENDHSDYGHGFTVNQNSLDADAHVNARGNGDMLYGGFASFGSTKGGEFVTAGVEGQFYYPQTTLYAQGGYSKAVQGNVLHFTDESAWYAQGHARYFETENLEFSVNAGYAAIRETYYDADAWRWGAQIEFKPEELPFGIFALYQASHADWNANFAGGGTFRQDSNGLFAGIRLHLNGNSPQEDDRRGVTLDDDNPFTGAGSQF